MVSLRLGLVRIGWFVLAFDVGLLDSLGRHVIMTVNRFTMMLFLAFKVISLEVQEADSGH